MFCGWSEDVDPFLCKGFDPVPENDLIFGLVDEVSQARNAGAYHQVNSVSKD